MTDGRVRTVFIGSGRFGEASLARLVAHPQIELVGVVTAPPRAAGRKGILTPTPIHDTAEALGLGPVLTPERLRAPVAVASVLALQPALVVLADYGQIVPPALLELPFGALNLHPSLLPRHRGATPIPAAILAGDRETGVSLIRMDAGLDTGPIVAQVRVPLDGRETTPVLEAALADTAADLLADRLGPWLGGEIAAQPQSGDGATLTRPLRREDGRLDPRRSAVELERQVRAYQPWPGSFVQTVAGRLVVWMASAIATAGGAVVPPPGHVDARGLSTADGHLTLMEVQPAGGRRMPWPAFVRGRPEILDSQVEPGP